MPGTELHLPLLALPVHLYCLGADSQMALWSRSLQENMDALRRALREMKDFTITCGKAEPRTPRSKSTSSGWMTTRASTRGKCSKRPLSGVSLWKLASGFCLDWHFITQKPLPEKRTALYYNMDF